MHLPGEPSGGGLAMGLKPFNIQEARRQMVGGVDASLPSRDGDAGNTEGGGELRLGSLAAQSADALRGPDYSSHTFHSDSHARRRESR